MRVFIEEFKKVANFELYQFRFAVNKQINRKLIFGNKDKKQIESLSFICSICRKRKQIKYLPHSAAEAQAVYFFDFCAVQIGCEMCLHSEGMKIIISGVKNFGHDFAGIAIVLHFRFEAEIIETISDWFKL